MKPILDQPAISFFVNTPLRDLPGIVLTAHELCQRGAKCYLVPQAGGLDEIWALAPNFVLLPAFRQYFASRVQRYIDLGISFGLLDTEGVIWSSMDEYCRTLWKDSSLSRKSGCICMWGPSPAEHMIGNGLFDPNQVIVTGCPRFDFYSSSLAPIYREIIRPTNGSKRKFVLINTNFTNGNHHDHPAEVFAERYATNFGYEKSQILDWCQTDIRAVDQVSQLAGRLATDFPHLDVVVRPHPQERIEPYQERVAKLSNIKLETSGPVYPWLLGATAVIQRGCTTAVEANLAGIPAISPSWIDTSTCYPIPESLSINCPDYDALVSVLGRIADNDYQLPQEILDRKESIVEKWFYRIDGLAHKRVADAILNCVENTRGPDYEACRRVLYGLNGTRKRRLSSLANRVRYTLKLSPHGSFRGRSSHPPLADDALDISSIEELVRAIEATKVDEKIKPVNVSRARDRKAYIVDTYPGRSITMSCT